MGWLNDQSGLFVLVTFFCWTFRSPRKVSARKPPRGGRGAKTILPPSVWRGTAPHPSVVSGNSWPGRKRDLGLWWQNWNLSSRSSLNKFSLNKRTNCKIVTLVLWMFNHVYSAGIPHPKCHSKNCSILVMIYPHYPAVLDCVWSVQDLLFDFIPVVLLVCCCCCGVFVPISIIHHASRRSIFYMYTQEGWG